jgi:DNA-binding GntR family transcriptional regulator
MSAGRAVRADGDRLRSVLDEALADDGSDSLRSRGRWVKAFLRDAIVRLRLPPGTPLSEQIVADCLKVSRTPVREAVRDLAAEGWLEIFPQAATVVAPISLSMIDQGCFIRNTLEGANLVDLVDRLDDHGRAAITDDLDRQAAALADHRWEDFYVLDDHLHHLFFELGGREAVWPLVEQVRRHVDRVRRLLMHRSDETCARALAEHREIVAALFDGRRDDVLHHLARHVLELKRHLAEYAAATRSEVVVK